MTIFRALAAAFALTTATSCSGAQGASSTPTPAPAQAATAAQQRQNDVVAEIGGRQITLAELEQKWQELDPGERARVTQLLYQNRRNVLDQLVGDLLIEEAAKAAGTSVEAFTEAEVNKRTKAPTDADVQQFYDSNKDRTQGRPLEALREPIRQFLGSQRKQQARAILVDELRTKAKTPVRVLLEPPRQAVPVAAHDPARGPADAPVTIIEYSDYECPFCGRVTPTLDKLLAAYPGKIRLVFKDFPLPNHARAPKASEAAHCAGEQNKYWEMHDRMFANQQALDVPTLKQHAATLSLNTASFDACLDSGKHAAIVQSDLEEGREMGVESTPTLYVNGRPVIGAQPYDVFAQIVEEELARAK